MRTVVDTRRELARRTRYVGGVLFLMTASFLLAKTARDALYFQADGIYQLPIAYIGMAVLSLPTATAMLTVMRWIGARRARVAAPLALAAVLAGFAALVRPGGGFVMTAFFMLIPLAYGVTLSLAWLLGADLLHGADPSARARAYGRVGAAALGGSVAGALAARALAKHVDPPVLLVIGAVVLAASAPMAYAAHCTCPSRTPATTPTVPSMRPLEDGIASLIRNRYLQLLLGIGLLASLVGILIEFQFYIAAATAENSGRENAALFATLYFALNAAALIVQLVVAPRLQRHVGLIGSLLVLPGALTGLAPVALVSGSLWAPATMRLTEGGLKSSIHRISWEQTYLLISASHRAAAKLLVDGVAARIAEGVAALLLYGWLAFVVRGEDLRQHSASWIAFLLVLALLAWIALTRALGRMPRGVGKSDAGGSGAPDTWIPDS